MPALPLETVHPLRACRLEPPRKIPLQGLPPYFRELGRDRLLLGQNDVRNLLDLLNAVTTIKGAAGRAHINKNTFLRYRHMLLRFMKNGSRKPVLSGKVEIDETYRGRSGRTRRRRESRGRRKAWPSGPTAAAKSHSAT